MKTTLARALLFTVAATAPAWSANQVLLRNLDPADGQPQFLAADRQGDLFVVYLTAAGSARVAKLDGGGSLLAATDVASITSPTAAATDAPGNLILAGQGTSGQGLVMKLNNSLSATLFSTTLPGGIHGIALDGAGNIYLTGVTTSDSFPVTPGAYQSKAPAKTPLATAAYAFLTEISADGSKVFYSTYFGDDATYCIGGSACVGAFGVTTGTAIALDGSGGAVIAGNTTADALPTTPGALATACACSYRVPAGFIAKFQPGGAQQLEWSTFLNGGPPANLGGIPVQVNSLVLDAGGDAIVGGSGPAGLPTTAGALQPSIISVPGTADSGGFVIELNRTGTAVNWGTYYGGSPFSSVRALGLDAQGRVLFTGVTVDPQVAPFPTQAGFRATYVARLASDGSTLVDLYGAPYGVTGQALAITAAGTFASIGSAETLWLETANAGPSLLAIANSASNAYASTITGTELVTLYGIGIGPQSALDGQVQNGVFTSSLGGYQVLFDAIPAPLLYAGSGQINAVVPRAVGASTHIQVVTPGGTVNGPTVTVSEDPVPGIFQNYQTGLAAALNQDGSVNSTSNPAKAGSIVTVYATGGGANYWQDGAIVPIGIYDADTTVWAGGHLSYEVQFAGDAPGIVAGVMQINFRIPDLLPSEDTSCLGIGCALSFNLAIGGVASPPSGIAVTP